jgi:predicted enzyme related to lactoylglutathione lyase
MSGEVVHFTLPADNADRARKFYSGVFGWKMQEMPGTDYTMVSTGPVDDKGEPKEPGFIGGGIGKRGDNGGNLKHPVVTIIVDEISSTEKSIEKSGGKILQRKQPIGDGTMGHTGMFQDSEGNIVGLFQAGTKR